MNKLIVILGPTASGKTELGIKLAKRFNGEIISCDSRQVFKEMDIGTAKPSLKETQQVPHHLINIVNPDQEFNVAIYKKLAIKTIREIQKRKKIPFLVGGTGLYLQAIVDNVQFPKVRPHHKLRKELEKISTKELFEIYEKLDPRGAKEIEKENKRRLIRAIEVCKVTGKPFSEQKKKGKPLFEILQIGIRLPKDELKKKIEKRVEKMFKKGLEKEVKKLFQKYGFNIPPMQSIGYQEFQGYFKKEKSINKVKEEIKLHTLQFAKRQMTWFKRDKRIKWITNKKEAERLIKEFLSSDC